MIDKCMPTCHGVFLPGNKEEFCSLNVGDLGGQHYVQILTFGILDLEDKGERILPICGEGFLYNSVSMILILN